MDLGYGGPCGHLHNLSPKSLLGFYRCCRGPNRHPKTLFSPALHHWGVRFLTIMEDETHRTHPSWRQGAKNTFSQTFRNLHFMPLDHQETPLQHLGTTRDPLGTTWHHQIVRGTTWEPYKAKTIAKTAAFFQSETAKIQISRPFLTRTLTDWADSGDKCA